MSARAFTVTLVWGAVAAACFGAADWGDFSRYQVIIDRAPFGHEEPPRPPPKVAPAASQKPVTPSFAKSIRMCALTDGVAGPRVGFVKASPKPEKSYFLHEGESQDGMEVVEIDYDGGRALLRFEGQTAWIEMEADPSARSTAQAEGAADAAGTSPAPRPGPPQRPGDVMETADAAVKEQITRAIRAVEEERKANAADTSRPPRDEAQKALAELIRAHTPERDN